MRATIRTRAQHREGPGRKGLRRLLGAQIVGIEGAAKRIDIFATALHAGMTAQEMINLDLSYAPPYSNVWDPVLIAARQVDRAVNPVV